MLGAVGLGLPLAAAGCGGTSAQPRIRFGCGASAVAACTAAERGFFKKQGLDVDLTQIQSGPAAVAATVAGSLDFTFGDFLGWVGALGNGFRNCRLIAPANGNGNFKIVARKEITSAADLVGKRIGVASPPMFGLSVRLWLQKIGIDPSTVKFVIVGQGAEHVLGRGDIDALLSFDPAIYRAEKLYNAHVIAGDPSEAVMPRGAGRACYYANGDFLKAHPDIVGRVVTALHQGARHFAAADQRERAEITAPYSGVSVDRMQQEMPGLLEHFIYTPAQLTGFDLAANQAWVDLAYREGALHTRVDIAPYVYKTALIAA